MCKERDFVNVCLVLKVVLPLHHANDYAAVASSETTYLIVCYIAFKDILYVSSIAEPVWAKFGPRQRAEREYPTISRAKDHAVGLIQFKRLLYSCFCFVMKIFKGTAIHSRGGCRFISLLYSVLYRFNRA
jgi:hypothetical protein